MKFKEATIFVWLLIPFILGIVVSYYFPFIVDKYIHLGLLVILLVAIVGMQFFYKKLTVYAIRWYSGLAVFLFQYFLASFLTLEQKYSLDKSYFFNYKANYCKLKILSEPKSNAYTQSFYAEVQEVYKNKLAYKTKGIALVRIYKKDSSKKMFQYGDLCIAKANFKEIQAPLNPAVFNYKKYLKNEGIEHQLIVYDFEVLDLVQNEGDFLYSKIISIRNKAQSRLQSLIKNKQNFGIVSALVLGDKMFIDEEIAQNFRDTGTLHILAISGMHVGIIYGFLIFIFEKLPQKKGYKWMRLCTIFISIGMYALIAGLCVSVLRASIMIYIHAIASEINKRKNNYNILAFTAYIILLIKPMYLFNIGFQLSFLAVLGILAAYKSLNLILRHSNKWLQAILSVFALTLSAQMLTFPLSIYYFHQFPLIFLMSNLWSVIPVFLILIGGFILLIPYTDFLATIYEFVLTVFNTVLHWMAGFEFLMIRQIWLEGYQIWGLFIVIIFGYIAVYRSMKSALFIAILALLLVVVSIQMKHIVKRQEQEVVFFSLKNHYALAFRVGAKAFLFSDLNKEAALFKFQIQPYLDQNQITSLQIDTLGAKVQQELVQSDGQQIHFRNRYYLILNQQNTHFKELRTKQYYEAVLLHHQPYIQSFEKDIRFKELCILATHKYSKSEYYINYLTKNEIKFYDLSKNIAYLRKIE